MAQDAWDPGDSQNNKIHIFWVAVGRFDASLAPPDRKASRVQRWYSHVLLLFSVFLLFYFLKFFRIDIVVVTCKLVEAKEEKIRP